MKTVAKGTVRPTTRRARPNLSWATLRMLLLAALLATLALAIFAGPAAAAGNATVIPTVGWVSSYSTAAQTAIAPLSVPLHTAASAPSRWGAVAPVYEGAAMEATGSATAMQLQVGWNLVAAAPGTVFGRTLFAWTGSAYLTVADPIAWQGYWLLASSAEAVDLAITAGPHTVSLNAGWNLVGNPMSSTAALTLPAGRVAFVYNSLTRAYSSTLTLQPGQGAWVKGQGVGESVTFTAPVTASQIAPSAGDGQSATAGTAVAIAPSVVARDEDNNVVEGVVVTFAVASGDGSITGATALTNASGCAAVGSWTLGTMPGAETLTATSEGLAGSPVTFTATHIPGPPDAGQATLAAASTSLAADGTSTQLLTVTAKDANGDLRTEGGDVVTITQISGTGTISEVTDALDGTYFATVTSPDEIGNGVFVATLGGAPVMSGETTQTETILIYTPAPTQIAPDAGSDQSATAGTAVTMAPSVIVRDKDNDPVADVSVTFAVASGDGSITGAAALTNASGIATVSSWTLGTTAGINTLTATREGLDGSPVMFTATGLAGTASAAQSTLTQASASIIANGTSTELLTVTAKDANGNPRSTGGDLVTITRVSGTGTISEVTDNSDGSYSATVTSPTTVGSGVFAATIGGQVVKGGLGAQTEASVSYVAGAATKLAIMTQPVGAQSGAVLGIRPVIRTEDANGNLVFSAATITVTSTGTLGGSEALGLPAVGGMALFTNLTLAGTAGTPYTLTFASAGFESVTSDPVSLSAGTADAAHSTLTPPSASVTTNGSNTAALTVTVRDAFDNLVVSGGASVTIVKSSGTGTIGPVVDNRDGTYVATVTSPTLVGTGVFVATLGGDPVKGGLETQTESTLTYFAGPAGKYLVASSDYGPAAGSHVTISAQLADAGGNAVRTAGNVVAWTESSGNGSFASATSITDSNGLATIVFTTPTAADTLSAVTATSLGSLTGISLGITTIAGAATQVAPNAGAGQSAPVDTAVAIAPSVIARDENNNAVAGVSVTFAVASGGGSVTGATALTNSLGVATVGSWTLGAISGINTVLAGSEGLTGSPVIFAATGVAGASNAAQSTLTPLSAGISANGSSTQPLTITARDDNGNDVSTGGDTVTITRFSGTGSISPVTDNLDGTYTATVTAPASAGSGVFVATIGGQAVMGGLEAQTESTITYASSEKAITVFGFTSLAATGTVSEATHTVAITVPFGTNVTALVAGFTTTGASVKVGGTTQVSGTTANNFTSPVTYTVTAADGSTQTYLVTVTAALNPAKALTAFSFASPAATGVVSEGTHTVAITVPFGTNVTALVASLTFTGASVKVGTTTQTSGTTANNFGSPVTYMVTAADGTTQDYVVTVTVAANPAKALTTFSFASPVATGAVTEGTHTVAITVPYGTEVSALVAGFTTTGASVKVGGTTQVSGSTANNFTSPVTYTVTAADGTTQDYMVTVTAAATLAIGDPYQGGKVAYILQPGDPGYVAGPQQGLIAATADQSAGIRWYNGSYPVTGATATALGTGLANTTTIIAVQAGTPTSYAAGLARAYNGGGYSDWYLPSKDELDKLYLNQVAIGGFAADYWSSSENTGANAWFQHFTNGSQGFSGKSWAIKVRPVRSFSTNPAKAITAFSFASPAATGVVTEGIHTVAITVPFGTSVTALVASFTTTGSTVKVGATVQTSGTTANNFASPVTYAVTAGDLSTQDYTVTVTVAAPAIGTAYLGGKVAYILQSGDPGYVAGETRGLIAAVADVAQATWSNLTSSSSGATGTAIGTGQSNTALIVGQAGHTSSAAKNCNDLVSGGYDDWYLPSKDEMNKLFVNRAAIGGFLTTDTYWNSSEGDSSHVWNQSFNTGVQYNSMKSYGANVRAIRSFTPNAKAITAFITPTSTGTTVNEAAHTVAVAVPFGTSVTALVPTITVTGASVSPASGVVNDFTSAVTYTVMAPNGSTQAYVVTVTVTPSPAKALTAFSLASPAATGVVSEGTHIVAITVPFGTNVTALVASFTSTGASVAVGATTQVSGTTPNNFTSPVIYAVTAGDTTTQEYMVTVSFTAPAIGQSYQGGKVAYILQSGDPGYVVGLPQGLIAATADQGGTIQWYNGVYGATGATATALGTGLANTTRIISVQGATATNYAAGLARAYTGGGYTDWYLPSKDELNKLYLNRYTVGGFQTTVYWSSSETVADSAWYQQFNTGGQGVNNTYSAYKVRAVRAFSTSPAKAITAFTTLTSSGTSIDETAHTIALTVPYGTAVNALVATFTSSVSSTVKVGTTAQTSGTTPNDFSSPAMYTVTAGDGSTQDYVVTVTVAAGLAIGDAYQGGKVAYILQSGDPGYEVGPQHGLIAATADQSAGPGIRWYNGSNMYTNGNATALGTGLANTTMIIAAQGAVAISYAAGLAQAHDGGGYSDWYLPSKDELNKLYSNQVAIGAFASANYWSSSEVIDDRSCSQYFATGAQYVLNKGDRGQVRAIRAF